jgi:hypothetical protein
MKPDSLAGWFDGLRAWAADAHATHPDLKDTAWRRLTPDGIEDAFSKDFSAVVPDCFDAIAPLKAALDQIEPLSHALYRHAVGVIAARMAELKQRSRQFGFADMLDRLNAALQGENGPALRQRIISQYPVALVDEFQDTAPNQYQIFNQLYRVADNDGATGLFLIGDPKQSIYGFRGADIHSYLAARAHGGAPLPARHQLPLDGGRGGGRQSAVPACRKRRRWQGFAEALSASAIRPTASIRCRSKRSLRARRDELRNGAGTLPAWCWPAAPCRSRPTLPRVLCLALRRADCQPAE